MSKGYESDRVSSSRPKAGKIVDDYHLLDCSRFLSILKDEPLQLAVKKHFDVINGEGFETAKNEDILLKARKRFYSELSDQRTGFLSAVEKYRLTILEEDLNSAFVLHELGRMLIEGRRREAYEVLLPLEEVLRRPTAENIDDRVKSRLLDSIGEAARFADRYDRAKHFYNKALELDSENHFAHKHLGTIFRIEKNLPAAERHFAKSIEIERTYHVLFGLAYLYHSLGHYDLARPLYHECIEELESKGIHDYYRVYIKMAYVLLIEGKVDEAASYLNSTQKSLNECGSDEFVSITQFAVHFLKILIEPGACEPLFLQKCRNYLDANIDRIGESVFYCVYKDINRVLETNPDLLHRAFDELERGKRSRAAQKYQEIIDHLHLKHALLQGAMAIGRIHKKTVSHDRVILNLKINDGDSRGLQLLESIVPDFNYPPCAAFGKEILELDKEIVARPGISFQSISGHIERLLDHGGLSCRLASENVSGRMMAMELQPFTALMSKKLRVDHFSDYFYVEADVDGDPMVRILSRKLIHFDPISRNRIFINPTIGCSIDCPYCYLPEYNIEPAGSVISAELSAHDYRRALTIDKRFSSGKMGTLLSVGSFCDPFLPNVRDLTVATLLELKDLKNPIQISTKRFPGESLVRNLEEGFQDSENQLMINVSYTDPNPKLEKAVMRWLNVDRLNLTIYIKPFLKQTEKYLSEYIAIGKKAKARGAKVSFVVGSLYYGDEIANRLTIDEFDDDFFEPSMDLVSPVVREPHVTGFVGSSEENFRTKLSKALGIPVYKTASCPLSVIYQIPDPLKNYAGHFCIGMDCENLHDPNLCRVNEEFLSVSPKGDVRKATRSKPSGNSANQQSEMELLSEKINFLRKRQAVTVDPALEFSILKQIEEAEARLKDIEEAADRSKDLISGVEDSPE